MAAGIKPYQFEPKRTDEDDDSNESDSDNYNIENENESVEEEEMRGRLARLGRAERGDETSWCKCNKCKKMIVNKECLCCQEIDKIKPLLNSGWVIISLFFSLILPFYIWIVEYRLNEHDAAILCSKILF